MFDLLSDIGRRAASALRAAVPDAAASVPAELPVVRAGKPEFGDYQISAALQLGKALKKPPRDLAQTVAAALAGHDALDKVEIAGPGFVNLHLKSAWLARRVADRMDDPQLGVRPVGRGQRVVIDFSSPNAAKPMHIGHIRSTIIGDAIARTVRALGYDVITDNHLGDWGTQFGKLIVAYRRWVNDAAYNEDPVAELLRIYIQFQKEEKRERAEMQGALLAREARGPSAGSGGTAAQQPKPDADEAAAEGEGEPEEAEGPAPPILEDARRELVKLQSGDSENLALWRKFIDDSRHAFQAVYDRLGVKFDYWLGESVYNDLLPTVVAELRRRNIATDSRGAVVVLFEESEKLPPFIVQKSDGGYNYATTDIATLSLRVGLFGASRIIVVTDERQQLHFRQLIAVGKRLGVTIPFEHVWFGLMRLPEGTISTREGNLIHLTVLLDEAERRATDVARAHNQERGIELSDAELREVGRVVGLGALKYNDLSKDRQTLVTFTWDKALSLQGNTAPYLQYAYARVRSIVRKGEQSVAKADVLLDTTVERDLGKKILAYPEVVEAVGRTARPHLLAEYLFELATAFSGFYAECPVLQAEPAVRASRLVLTELVARILQHGLALLGIEVLERM